MVQTGYENWGTERNVLQGLVDSCCYMKGDTGKKMFKRQVDPVTFPAILPVVQDILQLSFAVIKK